MPRPPKNWSKDWAAAWSQGCVWAAASITMACASAEEPARVALPVMVDNRGMTPVQTDLGYDVTLSEARLVVDDLQFTIAGEAHTASLWQLVCDLLIPAAHAHPGHYQGGDVTGELPGHFILDLVGSDVAPFGVADLIVGAYESSNFTFGQATASDGLGAGDPLLGHTAHLRGQATKDGVAHRFQIELDAPADRQLVGAPFKAQITTSTDVTVGFELMTRDPLEGDTLFDGIDFGALPLGAEGVELRADSPDPAVVDAYNCLRRTFMTHDHFKLSVNGAE